MSHIQFCIALPVYVLDSQLKVALMWPAGSYGLNEPRTGCPKSAFNWLTGWNRQDAEDYHNKNGWTSNIHLEGRFKIDQCK